VSWALVLSGVGTPALAWQTGLLAGLSAAGSDLTRPDLIVATSAGAIVGARLACGLPIDAAFARERVAGAASPRDLHGLHQALDELRRELSDAESWPDQPLKIPALDFDDGSLKVWTRSAGVPLPDAVASSCHATTAVLPWPAIKGRRYTDPGPISATNAQLAYGHRLVIVIAGGGPEGPLADEIAQLRAGGSHVRFVVPDSASNDVLVHNLRSSGRRAAAAKAGYAQGEALAPMLGECLRSRDTLLPEVDVEDLAARFAVPSLRDAEWTHVAHLAVGAWHVDRYGADDALLRLRDGIRRLNVSLGGTNTPTSGYHETITAAYVRLITAFLEACPSGLPLDARVKRLLASPLAGRNMLFTFYSRDRLLSTEARAAWVEPDLAPLSLEYVVVGLQTRRT
jgi:NTE family protein